ncbi:hypothetical protein SLS53_004843 [Cytospora paraplurivora]|uniref:chitinase n=1 Tax=Cytospora paraplurivora TaxID=2898453 RepID=A0AAN9U9Q3_9PEZI
MWGQCGSQPDYCTASSADSGAPGTAATGENGCISNCGLDIVVGDAPDSKYTVGYYEAFAVERDCLVMEAEDIPTDKYTHVHFGYANITDEFALQLEGAVAAQWAHFATMSEIKRILSFGGWAASTDADTYTIFRDMVKEENRATFIKHLVTFTLDYDVDGFDFDWEYPGEPDIPGIPAGSDDEGTNYLAFLTELRAALDDDITISIAAPASYWYLQSFPIANISKVVDYIVYMTYDLHGQWDYGNAYADTGCDNGDCLRSHVNMTETMWALSMVTKAGVPTNKIVVGCTATAGYLANAEILSIVTTEGTNATMAYDSKSRSNIVYYNNTWMAYMDSTEKAARTKNYTAYNFLGTVEWAIDLEEFIDDVDDSQDVWDCPDADLFTDLDSISANSSVPDDCLNYYVLSVMAANMTASLQAYTDLMNDDYEEKFKYYAKAVKSAAPDQWTSFYKNEYDNLTTCEWLGPKDGSPDSTEYLNQTGGCPPNDEPTFVTKNEVEVGFTLYTLFPNKTEFEDVAAGTYGLDVDWINYDAYTLKQQYCKVTDPIGKTIGECSEGQVPIWHQPELYDSLTVDDPSDIITSSLPNYQNVSNWLNDIVMDMSAGCFTANDVDAIDAMSVSVYTVDAAIAQMQQVSEVGEEVEEAEKKALEENLIFFFVSALLLLIPGLGEGLDAILDTTFLARMATLIGDVGDAALTLYSVYEDPDSAPIAIAGLLIGGAISREDSIFASAAKLRRAMSADDVAALGARAETNLKKIENMKQTCRV